MQSRSINEILDDIHKLDTNHLISLRDRNEPQKDNPDYSPKFPDGFESLMDEVKKALIEVLGRVQARSAEDYSEEGIAKKQADTDNEIIANRMRNFINQIESFDVKTGRNIEILGELTEQYIANKIAKIEQKKSEAKNNEQKNEIEKVESAKQKYNANDLIDLTAFQSDYTNKILENYERDNGLILGMLTILQEAKSQEKKPAVISEIDSIMEMVTRLDGFILKEFDAISDKLYKLAANTNNEYVLLAKINFSNGDWTRRRYILELAKKTDNKKQLIKDIILANRAENTGEKYLSLLDKLYQAINTIPKNEDDIEKRLIQINECIADLLSIRDKGDALKYQLNLIEIVRDLFKDKDFIQSIKKELEVELEIELRINEIKKFKVDDNDNNKTLMKALLKQIPMESVTHGVEILFPLKNEAQMDQAVSNERKSTDEVELNPIDTGKIERNSFNRHFFEFQMKNAYQIWDWQLDLKVNNLPKKPLSNDIKDNPRAEAIRKRQEEISQATIQFSKDYINNIKRMIETTSWKVSTLKILKTKFGGSKITIGQQDGHAVTKTVPGNIAKIYAEILKAEKDKNWVEHFNEIVELGIKASKPHFLDFFGLTKRDPNTQRIYDLFNELAVQKAQIDLVRKP